ncbi:MAG: response regulator [Desulfobacterales bacterium]|nr:MAG: response regulator [Desulfobacterales bacterium]
MFRSINSKFYAIVGVLVFIISIGYAILAYFLGEQSKSAVRKQEAVFIERQIRSLHDQFYEIRFWERAVLIQEHPEADKYFGAVMGQMRNRLMALQSKPLFTSVQGMLAQVLEGLTRYEEDFNKIIQSKTEQRLHRTRMDTSYRSLASFVLRSNKADLLKPLFNLTHFLIGYRIDRRESEHQALKLVIDSLEDRINKAGFLDDRVTGYLKSFRDLLDKDYALELEIISINERFDQISGRLMGLLEDTSRESERLLEKEFRDIEQRRDELNRFFLISTAISIITLLLILILISKKIIEPIRSMAGVMREVRAGNIRARSTFSGDKDEEIVQFGMSLNDMLDTLEKNNQELVTYQNELEKKVVELAFREKELEKHRNRLEELVEERTSELTKAVEQLQAEIRQRESIGRELKKHREDLEATIKERTADLTKTNRELETEIAERKKAERERQRLASQLQRAEKMEAIGTLAGGVAHDLNNILSGIVSYPELLLLDLPKGSPLISPILKIQESGQKAASIVQDLLTLARRGVARTIVMNINHIVLDYLKSPEHEKLKSLHVEIQVETELDPDLLNIVGSPIHLSKTIMNLVTNAAESMPFGGMIRICTQNRYIDRPITGYDDVEEGDYAVLSVSDTGLGISSDSLPRIFEPFYTKKVMGRSGTGLGLAVVWGTVKDHKGYIDVLSVEGKGSRLTLYFPVTREGLTADKTQASIEDYSGREESILVVDDVKVQREIASGILKKLGYCVTSVSNGEEAIAYMKENSADLLVLDMIMEPGIDGLETYKRILEFRPGQKAIIASGFSETERVKEAQKLGAGEYIKKPYTIEKIALAVKSELMK